MEEEIQKLKKLLTAINAANRRLRKVHLEAFEELLEQAMDEAVDELGMRIDDLSATLKEALRGFDE